MEKKLDSNYTRMLRAILNKSWRSTPTKQLLYGHLTPITKTIKVRRTRHAWHCWRSRDEQKSYILMWIPSHGRAKAGRPSLTYIQQLCADAGWRLEDLPGAMDDSDGWWDRVREVHAGSTTGWWWWWVLSICVCMWMCILLFVFLFAGEFCWHMSNLIKFSSTLYHSISSSHKIFFLNPPFSSPHDSPNCSDGHQDGQLSFHNVHSENRIRLIC